jgi:chitinase
LGASPEKLVLGIPIYGRSFNNVYGPNFQPPDVNFSGAGPKGPITDETGYLGYQEICMNIKNSGWTSVTTIDSCFSKSL